MQFHIQSSNELYCSVSGLNFHFDLQEVCITVCAKNFLWKPLALCSWGHVQKNLT